MFILAMLLVGFSANTQEKNKGQDAINIIRINSIQLPSLASAFYVEDNHCYVADGDSGLQIIDITDLNDLKLVGRLTNLGKAVEVIIKDRIAYIASIDSGLQIVDIADPRSPSKLSGLMGDFQPMDLEISGDFVYLVDKMSLSIINVKDVSAPFFSGNYEPLHYSTSIGIKDDYALSLHCYYSEEYCELVTVDISNPAKPFEVSHYDSLLPWDRLMISDDYLYVAGFNDGLRIFDISTISNPLLISHLNTPGSPVDFYLSDGKVFIIESYPNFDGIEIINCEDPKAPKSVCKFKLGNRPRTIFVQQDIIFIGADSLIIFGYQH